MNPPVTINFTYSTKPSPLAQIHQHAYMLLTLLAGTLPTALIPGGPSWAVFEVQFTISITIIVIWLKYIVTTPARRASNKLTQLENRLSVAICLSFTSNSMLGVISGKVIVLD